MQTHPAIGQPAIDQVVFYNYFRSSASYRLRIALALKQIDAADIVDIDLRLDEQSAATFQRINPGGLVPAFKFGAASYGQSLALLEWLDVRYPHPQLIPSEPEDGLAVRELALTIACDIHPLNNLRVLKYLGRELKVKETQRNEWYRHWVHSGFDTVEALIARRRKSGNFCLGEDVSLADICLIPQIFNARRFGAELERYPLICGIEKYCLGISAFRNTAPPETEEISMR